MDWISLAMLAPLGFGATLLLLRWARDHDRLPESLSTPILFGLVGSLAVAALVFADAAWTMIGAPIRDQQALLGSVEAGPLDLVEMRQTPVSRTSAAAISQWTFRVKPEALAILRHRCHDPYLSGDCQLAREEARGWATSASLVGDRLVISSAPVEP